MPIYERIVTDGITSEIQTVITAPLDEAALIAYVTEHNRRATFDGFVGDLEATCRREPPGSEDERMSPVYGSRFWYAREILMAIGATRHWLKQGHADIATAEAVRVGALAAEAHATHDWPLVQLGIKNRQSTKKAARTRGKNQTAEARALDQSIRQKIDLWKASDERITRRKLAKNLGKNERTIQRHLKKMGITISAF